MFVILFYDTPGFNNNCDELFLKMSKTLSFQKG